MSGSVDLRREGAVAYVTLSHPGRLNAMSRAMWLALRATFETLSADAALRCIDMLLAASVHGAQRLRDAGFLLQVLPDVELPAAVLAHAARVAALAPAAARLNKATFRALDRSAASDLVATAYRYADSAEHREGIAAFLAKRSPVF